MLSIVIFQRSSEEKINLLYLLRYLLLLLFFHSWSSKFPSDHLHLVWRPFVSISFRLGLLVTILSLPSSVFILTSFLRYVFTGYRIHSWQFFSFRILKMLFCLLWFLMRDLQLFELLFSIFNVLYFSSCFQDFFSVASTFRILIMMYLGVVNFECIFLEVCWASWICKFISFPFPEIHSYCFFKIFSASISLSSTSGIPVTQILYLLLSSNRPISILQFE